MWERIHCFLSTYSLLDSAVSLETAYGGQYKNTLRVKRGPYTWPPRKCTQRLALILNLHEAPEPLHRLLLGSKLTSELIGLIKCYQWGSPIRLRLRGPRKYAPQKELKYSRILVSQQPSFGFISPAFQFGSARVFVYCQFHAFIRSTRRKVVVY